MCLLQNKINTEKCVVKVIKGKNAVVTKLLKKKTCTRPGRHQALARYEISKAK